MTSFFQAIMRFLKLRWRLLLGIGISVLSLYLLLRNTHWAELWRVFSTANYWWLIPAVLVLLTTSYTRSRRWKLLIAPGEPISIKRLFHIVNIGYLFNNTLPAKLGELVRAYLVGLSIQGGFARAFSTLIVERLLDVLCVVVLLVILLPFMVLPAWAMRAGIIFGIAAVSGITLLVVLAYYGELGLDWLWRYLGKLPVVGKPRVRGWLSSLLAGLRPLTRPRLLPGIVLWSALLWLGYAVLNYVMLAAFHMTGQVSFAVSAFVLVATGFGMMIPSSPGAMGVFEAAVVLALGLYSIDSSQAFAYGFGLHMFTNLGLIVLGLIGLRSVSLTFRQVSSQVAGSKGAAGQKDALVETNP